MADATTEEPAQEQTMAPGDAPDEQQTPPMMEGFPVPDVKALAAEFMEQLKEQLADSGLEPLEDGWRCEVKIRPKITAMGPRCDKVRLRGVQGTQRACRAHSLFEKPPRSRCLWPHRNTAPPPTHPRPLPTPVLLCSRRQDAEKQQRGGALPAEPHRGGARGSGRPPDAADTPAATCA